jgi:hypothetical protein
MKKVCSITVRNKKHKHIFCLELLLKIVIWKTWALVKHSSGFSDLSQKKAQCLLLGPLVLNLRVLVPEN